MCILLFIIFCDISKILNAFKTNAAVYTKESNFQNLYFLNASQQSKFYITNVILPYWVMTCTMSVFIVL